MTCKKVAKSSQKVIQKWNQQDLVSKNSENCYKKLSNLEVAAEGRHLRMSGLRPPRPLLTFCLQVLCCLTTFSFTFSTPDLAETTF